METVTTECTARKAKASKPMAIFYQANKFNFFLSLFFIFCGAGVQIESAFILKSLFDIAVQGTLDDLWVILRYCVYYLGALILVQGGINVFSNRFQKKAAYQYKNHIIERILQKNISSFHKESGSNYISAFSNDLLEIEQNYLHGMFNFILQIALFICSLAAMLYLNWIITLCVLVTSALPILVSVLFSKKISTHVTNVSKENASFVALVKDLLSGFTVIKSFKVEKQIYSIFSKKNDRLEDVKKNSRILKGTFHLLSMASGSIVEFTLYGVGVYMALTGAVTVGVVLAFIQLANYVLGPINQIGVLFADIKAAKALIHKTEALANASTSDAPGTQLASFDHAIRYNNVSFAYEEGKPCLQDISVSFEKGKSYAIVGGSGSGKSTLLNLLLGYYDNYTGEVCIDGLEVKDIEKDSLYALLSVIQQNVFIFDDTIHDNITLFSEFDKTLLAYAVDSAGLTALLQDRGVAYKCGENGVNLSGGEKQRISIARSLVRQAPILLMDEGTAALDSATSHMIEEAILQIEGLTRIIVTHKMDADMMRKYDEIIVMHNGRIAEKGGFDALLGQDGYFMSLYRAVS